MQGVTITGTLCKLAGRLVRLTRLRRRRLEKGWTLEHLAQKSGLSTRSLSLLERGKRQPRPTTIALLAQVLGCQPVDLMEPET